MSKSSTTSSNKTLPAKSAWSRGPPQTSAPSPRSQSPAPPSTPTQSHLTHSRRPSALGQSIPIKDGVSIPRNNVGAAAAKPGSAVTFGSIDDASAPISSSPAAPPPTIKESVVKSFGTVPAASSNGKSPAASRPAVSTASASPSAAFSSSASSTPTSMAPAKLDKRDIAKLFQSASSAPASAETHSPSVRHANLPSQNQQPSAQPSSSQPSQFTPHYQPFVPGGRSQQNPGPSGGPSRSPIYPRQMPNGGTARPPAPPNGAPAPGMSSPRLAPPHVPQQPGPPVAPPLPSQPHMPPQMFWNGQYYTYPQEYGYSGWGYGPPANMPPQSGHPHPPHMAPPPHMPPHPMSPHNAPRNLQPGTPTLTHATPNPVHPPHPPPPLSHPNHSISSISSPPPTPSTARLNASSNTFVPQQRTASKILIKNPDGKEVALEQLTKSTATPPTAMSSGQASPYRQSSPGTPKRSSIRIESEDQRRRRLEEEEAADKERLRVQQEAEEKVKKEKEEEERKKREEKEKKEKERLREEEEKKEKERLLKEEEERKHKEEEDRIKKEAEEKEREIREKEEEKRRQEEEAERAKQESERKERQRLEDEERKLKEAADRKAKEEQRKQEEEKARQQAELEKSKKEELSAGPKDEPATGPPVLEEGEIAGPSTPSKDESKVKESLRINTVTSNTADLGKRRPANLDFSGIKSIPVASALSTARNLETLEGIKYPEGIQSPKPELNENAKPGRFRYDRDFLLQFREVCKDKPPNLPPLDAIGLEPIDQAALMMNRGGSGRRGASSTIPSRQASVGGMPFGGPSGLGKPGSSGFSGMGNFTTPGRLSSEDRFAMSNNGTRSPSVGGAAGLPFAGRPTPMQRTASQGGQIRERTRSKRGEKRPPAENKGNYHDRNMSAQQQQMLLEPVAPLQASANRWDRKSLVSDGESPEVVDRKVKGLLNKLTMEKFDSISNQIIEWANKSEKEKDGRTLIQVIRLVFEKATDEATWSEMYARLCRKMMEQISPKVQDDGIKNADGKPIAGGQLFRKYLLNRCQEDFERGWVAKEATAAAAKAKQASDDAAKAANEAMTETKKEDEEVALYSEEYYAAQKAKRQGLGLIKFIGELFKLQMLTERIMHECVKKLLGNVDNPEEEEIESLCKLLTTVGALLDTAKAHAHMDIYFSRMKELTKSTNVSSRMQFMLQDVIEMRGRKWVSRIAVAAPTTLAQVHENVAKEKAAQEKENLQRQLGMSRTGSNRGRGRNDFEQGPDGWAVAGSSTRPVSTKAGDLSNFGKIPKPQAIQNFGPTSVFSKQKAEKRESISRSSSSSNMFLMLSQTNEAPPEPKPERRKLVLQPRTVPKSDEAAGLAESENGNEEEEEESVPEMSEADAKKKIDEDSKELFGVRNLDEAEVYFTALPSKYHHKLVDKLVNSAVESKAADGELVASLFERASSKQLCAGSAFEEGFIPIVEFLDDIAIDAPHAFSLYAKMVKGAKLGDEAHRRIAATDASEKLLPLLS